MSFFSPNEVQMSPKTGLEKVGYLDSWTFGLIWTLFGLDKTLIFN